MRQCTIGALSDLSMYGHGMRRAMTATNPLFEGVVGEDVVEGVQQVELGGVLSGVGGQSVVVGVEQVQTADEVRRRRRRYAAVVLLLFRLRRRQLHDLCSTFVIERKV